MNKLIFNIQRDKEMSKMKMKYKKIYLKIHKI